ncbi:unnamed protein product [Rhizopus stolonifer]
MEQIESLLEKIVEYKSNNPKNNNTKDRATAYVSKKLIFKPPGVKKKFKRMFNIMFSPLGLNLQINGETNRINVKRSETANLDPQINSIQDAIIAEVIQPDDEIETIDDWIWKIANIDKPLSDALLKVYFAYIHQAVPVLNKTIFLEEYRRIRPNFPHGCLLLAIYATAANYISVCERFEDASSLNDGKPWNISKDFSEKLLDKIRQYIGKRYLPRLVIIQTTAIFHVHPFKFDKHTHGWISCFSVVRMCQDLEFHKSSETIDISLEEKETRRRTWWSLYILDRWIAGDSGRPFTAIDEDISELYPSEYASFDEVMDSMTETDQHLPRFPSLDKESSKKCKSKMVPIYQPFIQMVKLSRILGMILKNLYTPQGKKYCIEHGSDSVVGYLDNALSEWRANLPPLLNISSAGKMSSKNEEHIPLISMTGPISLFYYTLLILLHRPFIKHDPENKKLSSQTSLTICTSAAIKVIEISECMNYRDFLLVSWTFALYPLVSATLIHAFNVQSPDKTISITAKSNLVRGLALMDKLNSLSPFKEHVENTIRKGILNSNLCTQDPELAQILKTQQRSKIEFVFKNTTNQESKTTQDSETPQSKDSFEYKTDECTTPSFTDDYHWLDMLYVSSQHMSNQNMFQGTSNMQQLPSEDMCSIRQFGFNTAGLDPLFQHGQDPNYIHGSHSNQLYTIPYTDSNQNMLNSFQSGLPFGEQYTMEYTNTDVNHSLCNDSYSNASYGPPLLHNLETITDDSFWGVPNGMNIEDWYVRLVQGEFQ